MILKGPLYSKRFSLLKEPSRDRLQIEDLITAEDLHGPSSDRKSKGASTEGGTLIYKGYLNTGLA